jgi:glucose-6-phosphate 1-dehydrogenase
MSTHALQIETYPHPGEPVVRAPVPDPCALVLFGATGDLAQRKLFPALYELTCAGLLPDRFAVVAFSRSSRDAGAFRQTVREGLQKHARTRPLDRAAWEKLAARIEYVSGGHDDPAAFRRLREALEAVHRHHGTLGNQLTYLSTPPSTFAALISGLVGEGLLPREGAGHTGPWHRLVIEKPFGRDLQSAQALNRTLWEALDERQIFRIDHFLGKETVQNILVFRLANAIFEPLWNRHHVDHVEITSAETLGVEGRGPFYDETGVIRDVVQNHLLQVLALCAMEPPVSLSAEDIRDEKNKVFRALRPVTGRDVEGSVVVGQYAGYATEPGVAPGSRTPTYAALRLFVDTWRWKGVPFYVRAGKRLSTRVSEVSVHFKAVPFSLFSTSQACQRLEPNVLTFRIQPEEGINLRFESKVPGEGVNIAGVSMDFGYAGTFNRPVPEAYERLLLDCMRGDATLFARADSVEQAWTFISPIIDALDVDTSPLHTYAPGSAGPPAAAALLARDGRRWTVLR